MARLPAVTVTPDGDAAFRKVRNDCRDDSTDVLFVADTEAKYSVSSVKPSKLQLNCARDVGEHVAIGVPPDADEYALAT